MGLPRLSIRNLTLNNLKPLQLTPSYFSSLFSHIQHFLTLMIFSQQLHTTIIDDDRDRPPPSSVAVPAAFSMAESIKKQLPVKAYSSLVEKSSSGSSSSSSWCVGSCCIVCMNEIEGEEEVRVPMNCRHVFHKECLDAWIDQGQPSCPLCRSKLLPSTTDQDQDPHGHDDPWRKERMMYLFGHDYLFHHHN